MKIRTANPGCHPDLSPAEAFMESTFPGCIQTEKHYNTLQYKISSSSLARIFQMVLVNKDKLNIEDYSVSQTTLDQVDSSSSIYSSFLSYETFVMFYSLQKQFFLLLYLLFLLFFVLVGVCEFCQAAVKRGWRNCVASKSSRSATLHWDHTNQIVQEVDTPQSPEQINSWFLLLHFKELLW